MYYEEKIIDGVLWYRNDPHDEFVVATLELMLGKLNYARQRIRELEDAARWRITADEPPTVNGEYLVYVPQYDYFEQCGWEGNEYGWEHLGAEYASMWMPIPPLPKPPAE